jgi:hypothetical protein
MRVRPTRNEQCEHCYRNGCKSSDRCRRPPHMPAWLPRLGLVAEQPVDSTKQKQLPLAVRASTHVAEQIGIVAILEQIR